MSACLYPWVSSIQCACAVLYRHLWPRLDVQYFSTLPHERQDFRQKKMLLDIKCVFSFSLQYLYETFLILRIILEGTVIIIYRSTCKVPVILVRF